MDESEAIHETPEIGDIRVVGLTTNMDPTYCWERVSTGEYLGRSIRRDKETSMFGGITNVVIFEHNKIPVTFDLIQDEKVRRVNCRQVNQSMTASSYLPDFMRNPPSMFSSRGEAAAAPTALPEECMIRIRQLETELRSANATIARLQRDIINMRGTEPVRGVSGPPQGGKKQKTRRKKQSRNKY